MARFHSGLAASAIILGLFSSAAAAQSTVACEKPQQPGSSASSSESSALIGNNLTDERRPTFLGTTGPNSGSGPAPRTIGLRFRINSQ